MYKMKLQGNEEVSSYHARLEQWTSKELQLNMLHEEIINKREALLRTSRNYLSGTPRADLPPNNTEAAIRNDKLMEDITVLEETLSESMMDEKSPRFAYLQANYWSMVKNMFPIWEKSMKEVQSGAGNSRQTTHGQGVRLSDLANV